MAGSTLSDDEESMLEDSTYDLLSDSLIILPSDDEDSASLASSCDHDDAESMEDFVDEDEDVDHEDDDDDDVPDTAGIPTFAGLDTNELEDSTLTVLDDDQTASVSTIIKVEEDGTDDLALHFMQEYTTEQILEFNEHLKLERLPKQLDSCLFYHLPSKALEVDHFRILYVGDEAAKAEIITKISTALVVTSSSDGDGPDNMSTRFNVIPVSSFGNVHADPEVELIETFGVQVFLDTCTIAGNNPDPLSAGDEHYDELTLGINPRVLVKSTYTNADRAQISPQGYELPHLIVMYRSSSDDSQAPRTRKSVRDFAQRHSLSVLEISDELDYTGTEEIYNDTKGPVSMCLLGERIYKHAPIDRDTFLKLDVRQLNRNLAYATSHTQNPPLNKHILASREKARAYELDRDVMAGTVEHSIGDENLEYGKTKHTQLHRRSVFSQAWMWTRSNYKTSSAIDMGIFILKDPKILTLIFLTLALVATFVNSIGSVQSIGTTHKPQQATSSKLIISTISVTTSQTVLSLSTPILASKIASASKSTASVPPSSSTATVSSTAISVKVISSTSVSQPSSKSAKTLKSSSKALLQTKPAELGLADGMFAVKMKVNDTEQFRLHVIGNGHIILKPAEKYTLRAKPPRLYVNVTRKGELIASQLSQPFSNVYSLSVDQEQAWGLVNVSIHTKQKPRVSVCYEIDLGSPWLRIAGIKKVAEKSSVDVIQAIGKTVSLFKQQAALASTEVQHGLEMVSSKAQQQLESVKSSTQKVKRVSQKLISDKASNYQQTLFSELAKFSHHSQELMAQAQSGVALTHRNVNAKVEIAQKQAARVWSKKRDTMVKEKALRKKCKTRKTNGSKGSCKKASKKAS